MSSPQFDSFPDRAHQDLLDRAFAADQQIRDQTITVSQAMFLINMLADLANTLGAAIPAAEATHDAINTRIDATNINVATALANDDALQKAMAALTARVAALEARTLRGTTGSGTVTSLIAAATSTVVITLKTAMPNATYTALPIIDATTGLNLSTVTATVTAKTATTVTVQVKNTGLSLLSTVNLTVVAIDLS